jgi:threonylcarbamoyladenosine tRNA methylthiotransferase MtaB
MFRHKVEKIKQILPHAFIGVDVIVGVRGENDDFFVEGKHLSAPSISRNCMCLPIPNVPVRQR